MPRLERGLLQVYTGDGKGKTTAAVGQAVRARGAGLHVCFIQFVKGGEPSNELAMLRSLGVEVFRPAITGTGLLRKGITEDDRQAASAGWEAAERVITSGEWDVVVLDELHIALHYDLVSLASALEVLARRPAHVEVITTGRHAPASWSAAADLVTEMMPRRHPFQVGVTARRGIEY